MRHPLARRPTPTLRSDAWPRRRARARTEVTVNGLPEDAEPWPPAGLRRVAAGAAREGSEARSGSTAALLRVRRRRGCGGGGGGGAHPPQSGLSLSAAAPQSSDSSSAAHSSGAAPARLRLRSAAFVRLHAAARRAPSARVACRIRHRLRRAPSRCRQLLRRSAGCAVIVCEHLSCASLAAPLSTRQRAPRRVSEFAQRRRVACLAWPARSCASRRVAKVATAPKCRWCPAKGRPTLVARIACPPRACGGLAGCRSVHCLLPRASAVSEAQRCSAHTEALMRRRPQRRLRRWRRCYS